MSAPAVEVTGLTRVFDQFIAVDHIDLRVDSGTVFGFLGPNGAGKSTTIRMLCGILRPSAGHGTVGGFDIVRQTEQVKSSIGYMSQRFSLYEDLTVEENLLFFAGIYNVRGAQRTARIAWALEMAGLRGREAALTGTLSSGWKQRLALGCAVLHQPPIVFLDEPTSGVDPISRRKFWDLIHEMVGRGVTVFVTTHYMDEAEYCNRLALIDRGRIVALGTPTELKQTAMDGELLLVECEPLGPALEIIQHAPDVLDAAVFGSALHVLVPNADAAIHALESYLPARGIRVGHMEPIRPSLEDVFVSLTARRGRKAEEN